MSCVNAGKGRALALPPSIRIVGEYNPLVGEYSATS
jgi:hypothetical protein